MLILNAYLLNFQIVTYNNLYFPNMVDCVIQKYF